MPTRRGWIGCTLGLLLAGSSASALPALATDHDHEVVAAPEGGTVWPALGPVPALVTVDLFLPLLAPGSVRVLNLALLAQQRRGDVRLVYHPQLSGPSAESGAEILWEARAQGRFWPMCQALHAHPEVLQQDKEPQLRALAGALGLNADRLLRAQAQHRYRAELNQLAQREPLLQSALEVWVNGHRLPSLDEAAFVDELDRGRERARDLLRRGVRWDQLAARLLAEDRDPRTAASNRGAPGRRGERDRPPPLRPELRGSPSRGPVVTPVTLVLFGSLDSFTTLSYARAASEVQTRRPGQVRLVFKHLPAHTAALELAVRGAQLAVNDASAAPGAASQFWGFFDALTNQRQRRFVPAQTYLMRLLEATGPISETAQQQVARDQEEARRLHLPTLAGGALLLNGQVVRGIISPESLDAAVRDELRQGLLARLLAH